MTIDFPSKNENRRLTVLNTEQWVEDIEIEGQVKRQISFSHYTKPMPNRYVVLQNLGLSAKSKENILVTGLLTVMSNISVCCASDDRKEKVEFYVNRMRHSGYSKKQRAAVYWKVKEMYNRKVQRHNQNGELGRTNEIESFE